MSHVCPAASRIGEPTVFCPTTGTCTVCGGLLCPVHGCQMSEYHRQPAPEKEASHAR